MLDSNGNAGFPGFDPTPAQSWATSRRCRNDIPVTLAYIADVHDDHTNRNDGNAFGPGQAGYEAQLRNGTRASPPASTVSPGGINRSTRFRGDRRRG